MFGIYASGVNLRPIRIQPDEPSTDRAERPNMIELYRGATNAWECDEMGHMNVRFYVARAMESCGYLAHLLGLHEAFAPGATGTLMPVTQHIRFHRECRAGVPHYVQGGLVSLDADDAVIYQELRHATDDTVSATFVTRFAHVEARSGARFAWPSQVIDQWKALRVKIPAHGSGRGLDPDAEFASAPDVHLSRAEKLGVKAIGRYLIQANDCDAFGRVRPDYFVGRISDSVPNMLHGWRAGLAQSASSAASSAGGAPGEQAPAPKRIGAAVLEMHTCFRQWPRAGQLMEVRSALVEVNATYQKLTHRLLDPVSGQAYSTSRAVAVSFDLDARKVHKVDADGLAQIQKLIVPGYLA